MVSIATGIIMLILGIDLAFVSALSCAKGWMYVGIGGMLFGIGLIFRGAMLL